MARKRGLPEDHKLDTTPEGVTEVADLGDFIDEFEPARSVRPKPSLSVIDGGGEVATATDPEPKADTQPQPVAAEPVRQPPAEKPKRAQQKKAEPEPKVVVVPRKRPPRKEIGFDPETLTMLGELHRDGMEQSAEESLTRSEVARAALRAVREARNYVDYSSCGRRGKWGTATQRALQDDLTEAYIRAIGKLYVERYHSSKDV